MKRILVRYSALASVLAFGTLACAADDRPQADSINRAVAVIMPTKASGGNVAGIVQLAQEKGYVHLTGQVTGLDPGQHGFHIHMYGDVSAPDGTSAGGHYNPDGHPHGGLHSKQRHDGDLGNIDANGQGVAKVNVKAQGIDLHHIIGRSIVVHGGADDLESQPSGNAGPRVGIGVIGLAENKTSTAAK